MTDDIAVPAVPAADTGLPGKNASNDSGGSLSLAVDTADGGADVVADVVAEKAAETGADLIPSDIPIESEAAQLAVTPREVVPVVIPEAAQGAVCHEQRFNEVTGRMDRFDVSGARISARLS